MKRIVTTVVFALVFPVSAARAATFDVYPDGSGPTPTIQSAIDAAAVSGDGIRVHAGVYHEENLLVEGKEIFLQGYSGIAVVVSSLSGQGTGMTLRNVGSQFILMGIELRDFETGLVVENGSASVAYCNFAACGTGLEISGASSTPAVSYCVVDSCATGVSVGGGAVTIGNLTIVNCGVGIAVSGGSATIRRNIICCSGSGVACSGGSVVFSCNDFHLNTLHYDGCAPGADDIYELPRFCYGASGSDQPYLLHIDSPCWARNNPCEVNMGAFNQIHGCEGASLEETSWGAIKSLYR